MKIILFLLVILCALNANGQDYLITFAGTGASTTVSTVKVENLTKGTNLTLNGSDVLHLTSIATVVNSFENNQASIMKIYPNPMNENSTLEIYPPKAGDATISIYEVTGKLIAQTQSFLERNRQVYRLSGLQSGLYLINIKGNDYQYSGKLLCNSKAFGTINIEKIANNQVVNVTKTKMDSKGILATVDMNYTQGDRLKFTGASGNYSTVVMDIPTSSKTITFNFIGCTDGDNNNYPVVEIGTQIWMAENLKTTKYNDGSAIPNITDDTAWAALSTGAYCDYNNTPSNSITHGRLYNWYTVDNYDATKVASNGGKNVCPTGWHIPADAEWTTLNDYLTNNGYGYEGSGNEIAKSIAATSGWITDPTEGNVGNEQASNNSSGFTALPSGHRLINGLFFDIGNYGGWWNSTGYSATSAYYRYILYNSSQILRYWRLDRREGLSVRCLKDN